MLLGVSEGSRSDSPLEELGVSTDQVCFVKKVPVRQRYSPPEPESLLIHDRTRVPTGSH